MSRRPRRNHTPAGDNVMAAELRTQTARTERDLPGLGGDGGPRAAAARAGQLTAGWAQLMSWAKPIGEFISAVPRRVSKPQLPTGWSSG